MPCKILCPGGSDTYKTTVIHTVLCCDFEAIPSGIYWHLSVTAWRHILQGHRLQELKCRCQGHSFVYLLCVTLPRYMALNKIWSCVYGVEWSVDSECLKIPRKSQVKVTVPQPKSCWGSLVWKLMRWCTCSWQIYIFRTHGSSSEYQSKNTIRLCISRNWMRLWLLEISISHLESVRNKKLPSLQLGCQWNHRSALREICVKSLPNWS